MDLDVHALFEKVEVLRNSRRLGIQRDGCLKNLLNQYEPLCLEDLKN